MDYNDRNALMDPKEELITLINDEISNLKQVLSELKGQIEQQQMMVNREQQNYTDLAAEVKNIEHNIDTVPRTDIRDKYNEALNTSQRLLTMRGQLEKFQSNFEYMQKEQQMLSQLLSKIQGVELGDIDTFDDGGDTISRTSVNIVRIVQAQEEERQRLARQMHDGPAQSLTNFILQAEICQRLFDRNPQRAGEELDNLKTTASVTFQKVRDFIFDLRPMMLDDLGVIPTVRRYVTSFKEKNDIEVNLDIAGEERRLESYREVLIFRGIQELMTLARDYSSPTVMDIRLDMSTKRIKILVEDNGKGFDTNQIYEEEGMIPESQLDPRVTGIITLKEKFELVDGLVRVESNDSDGTSVRLELPSGE